MHMKVPPPLYLLLFGAVMWGMAGVIPLLTWNAIWSVRVGWILVAGGVTIDLISLWYFIQSKTTINPHRPHKTSTLVVEGMYRFTRNPMYLGMMLVLLGWGLVLSCLSALLLVPVFMVTLTKLQIEPEEKALLQLFGDDYQAYLQRVRRWL